MMDFNAKEVKNKCVESGSESGSRKTGISAKL